MVTSARVFYKVVVFCKEDAWRPRHVLLIGNIVSCILTLFVHCLIPAVYFCFPDVFICRFFIAIYRLPYIAFLLNNFLSLVDRFVAVTRSTWHRLTLTKWYCAAWLAVLNLALAVAVKWMYIGQFKSVECAFHLSHSITLIVTILILSVLNTVALAAVFIATWRQLPTAARAIPVPFIPPPVAAQPAIIDNAPTCAPQKEPNPADIVYVPLMDLLPRPTSAAAAAAVSQPTTTDKVPAITVDVSSSHLRRMELEVTKHFLFAFIPLALLVLLPGFLFGFLILVDLFSNSTYIISPDLIQYLPYLNLIPSMHVVIYPMANLFLNKEISFSCSCSCCCVFPWLFCPNNDTATTADQQKNLDRQSADLNNLYG